ncbi:hypothetical protein [Algoriphagus sp. AK58]|uniref:hypothetical protein n=1 Tax=Algoriphagus sp. AK58 TaxID=1406877 RepID=UPI00164F0C4C|nr:hypothetical protein [Algoriphagus sp. AK58]MBC6368646.1 hypothetical protein [Algoriphagus sp. AK58]
MNAEEIEKIRTILNQFLKDLGAQSEDLSNLFFLNGIFGGLLASGDFNTYERYKLGKWLDKNDHLRERPPFDELFDIIYSVLEAKKVDKKEAKKLKSFFLKMDGSMTFPP